MLYHLTEWLRELGVKFPGSALFQFITSRVMLAVILSLLITTVFGKKLINYLLKKQVGETVRDLGLAGEQQKKGTPTMGGLIIILAILVPTLLLADLHKAYIRLDDLRHYLARHHRFHRRLPEAPRQKRLHREQECLIRKEIRMDWLDGSKCWDR